MDLFFLFMFRICQVFLSVHCSLVVTCWERADLLALLYVMFKCVFITFPCGVLGQMWCLIVSVPDLCLLSYFYMIILYDFYLVYYEENKFLFLSSRQSLIHAFAILCHCKIISVT